jgi:cyclopropane fatty-acyl-phospholipid synthase-like methyltransferase
MKPFSEACEQNKLPILDVIRPYFVNSRNILEIGSGTGQHAVFFADQLPHLQWHCSDVSVHHQGIEQWLADYSGHNISGPYDLDVIHSSWPAKEFDGVFSANTAHIMSWSAVEQMFAGTGKVLEADGIFCLYGPFNYGGHYTSASNEQFDKYLKARDPQSGIRDVDDLKVLAMSAGLEFTNDHEMPVNNRILVWKKS